MKKPNDIVREGYNKVSYAYREDNLDSSSEKFFFYKGMTDEITNRLDSGSSVLDLGCGCGIPTSRLLAEKFQVTGVDISPVQIQRAGELVPNARFLCGDMFWSHTDNKTFESWLTQAGFTIHWTRFIPEEDYGHWLMFTTKVEESTKG